jgi:hypothetical protein
MLKNLLVDYNPVTQFTSKMLEKVTILGDLSIYLKDLIFNKDDPNL